MSVTPHLRDRFFQRYGRELTQGMLKAIIGAAVRARGKPDSVPGRERVSFYFDAQEITMVWNREHRLVFTFLPARVRIAWSVGKGRR